MTPTAAATIIPVSDMARSLAWYTGVLGFAKRFEYGGFYAGLELGPVQVHLNIKGRSAPGSADVYVFTDEVDVYHAAIAARGARIEEPPKTYPYGMRDFGCLDPDGNRISFGCPVDMPTGA